LLSGALFVVAAICDSFQTVRAYGWHWKYLQFELLVAGMGLYLVLLAVSAKERQTDDSFRSGRNSRVVGKPNMWSTSPVFVRVALPVQTVDATPLGSFDLAMVLGGPILWVAVRFYLNRTPFLCFCTRG
jgi:hypothetical protein